MNSYGTHQRMLVRAMMRTTGPVLELGSGWYSTPILHEIAVAQGRFLFSQDNDPTWLKQMSDLFSENYHRFSLVSRTLWMGVRWGLVFVDHGPPPYMPKNKHGLLNALDRGQAVLDLMDRTDVFVLHDTEPRVRWEYDWDKILPLFKYRVDDTTHQVHASLLSNRIDVTKWS